jgi:hypothetical protein
MANRKRMPLLERFWEYVTIGEEDECWPWKGSLTDKGYGQFRLPDRIVKAHRFSWALAHNVTPDALRALPIDVHHTCENNDCVNPNHLFAIDSDSHDRLHARDLSRMVRRLSRQ